MRYLYTIFLLMAFTAPAVSQPWIEHGPIVVNAQNPHFLQHHDGTPFFWLADTGWDMMRRLNREEMKTYLENRKKKGFNVIQAMVISEFIHADKPTNYYGVQQFIDEDPERPAITPGNNFGVKDEYDFWDHIDYGIELASSMGLYMGLVATWGEWVIPRVGKPLFDTCEQAYNYGWFLGNRYHEFQNIIWILGGDRHPDEREEGLKLWRSMAEGIADGTNGVRMMDGKADYSTTLMTHHAFESSSRWFDNDEWIDFDMWGSYHAIINNSRAYQMALADWNRSNPRPTINAEPCYEGHGINYAIADTGFFTSTDVRQTASWSVFSGSAGYTYGAHPVWQFTDQFRKKHSAMTQSDWQHGLDLPGSFQVGYLKELMLSRPLNDLQPDTTMIIAGQDEGGGYCAAIRALSYAYLYIPEGNIVTVKMDLISGEKVNAWWFDPRTGKSRFIGAIDNHGAHRFDQLPAMSDELAWLKSGRGCDWILILEDASKTVN